MPGSDRGGHIIPQALVEQMADRMAGTSPWFRFATVGRKPTRRERVAVLLIEYASRVRIAIDALRGRHDYYD